MNKKLFANELADLINEGDIGKVVAHCEPLRKLSREEREEIINHPEEKPPFHESALHRAAFAGHIPIVRYLLEMGSDPFSIASLIKSTPLHSAAASGQTEIIRFLIGKESTSKPAPINHQTTTGFTALHSALHRGHMDVAKVLVTHGASLDLPNSSGKICRPVYEKLLQQDLEMQSKKSKVPHIVQMNGVSIQIASDLHLEFYGNSAIDYSKIIRPSAPILALLGDIGIPDGSTHYIDFLLHMAGQFEMVLVVAGNHEYYHCKSQNISYEEVKTEIRRICSLHKNLIFMDKESLLINGVRILGCTLWSYIPPNARDVCGYSLADYGRIMIRNPRSNKLELLDPTTSTKWFEEELSWLEKEIQKSVSNGESAIAILTHHTPSFFDTSADIFTTHPWKSFETMDSGNNRRWINCCFSSDLEKLFNGNSTIKVWAYGHTHSNNDQIIGHTRLVSNQRGYVGKTEESYLTNFVFYVPA